MTRDELLLTAKDIISGERQQDYGDAKDNFAFIGRLWSDYLGCEVKTEDVAIMMTLLKIARIKTGQYKDDTWIDAIGYLALGGERA